MRRFFLFFVVSISLTTFALPPLLDTTRDKHYTVSKEILEKPFIFYGYLFDRADYEHSFLLNPRIVFFRKQNQKLFLLEKGDAHSGSPDLKQDYILFEYAITDEKPTELTIDLSSPKRVFAPNDTEREDDEIGNTEFRSLPVTSAIIGRKLTKGKMEFRYEATLQVERPNQKKAKITDTISVAYYFKPLVENKEFKPLKYTHDIHKNFFHSTSIFDSKGGELQKFAGKFDLKKPIVFVLSGKIPAEYRETMKEAILYWNSALEKNLITVRDARAGEDLFTTDDIFVDWVKHDTAKVADGHFSCDPTSGEIILARIYFPTMWEKTAKDALRNDGVEEKDMLERIRDLLASTASHESGHIMGLQHNFAASTQTKLSVWDMKKLYGEYLKDASFTVKDVLTSSTMDYFDTDFDFLIGRQIRKEKKALVYDRKAIQGLYFENPDYITEVYCSDSTVMKKGISPTYLDCQKRDASNNPVQFAMYQRQKALDEIVDDYYDAYLSTLKKLKGTTRFSYQHFLTNEAKMAEAVAEAIIPIVQMGYTDSKFVATEFEKPTAHPRDLFRADHAKIVAMLKDIQPLYGSLLPWSEGKRESMIDDLSKTLDRAIDRKDEYMTPTVKKHALALFNTYLETLDPLIAEKELNFLSRNRSDLFMKGGNEKIVEYEPRREVGDLLTQYFYDRLDDVLFRLEAGSVVAKLAAEQLTHFGVLEKAINVVVASQEIPSFYYKEELRKKYAVTFRRSFPVGYGPSVRWREITKVNIEKFMKEILQFQDFAEYIKTIKLNNPHFGWIEQQLQLQKLLDNEK